MSDDEDLGLEFEWSAKMIEQAAKDLREAIKEGAKPYRIVSIMAINYSITLADGYGKNMALALNNEIKNILNNYDHPDVQGQIRRVGPIIKRGDLQ